mmetsp:Transcript_21122/g.27724  ORF Transcript_21122/g.27724 Transcript_21122/m.27724 type:complete len:135 (+) Transcript_21122:66-470(+)
MDSDKKNNSLIFKIFDGKNFREWKELMILFLMGLGLWTVVSNKFEESKTDEDSKPELALLEKKMKAYAILSLNLTSSCRDCLRDLPNQDPASAWEAILKKFEARTPLDKLMALDELISFALDPNDIPDSLSRFK